jgi:hypothetical protein
VSAALGSGTRLRLQQGFQFRAFSGDEQFRSGRMHARPPELAVAPPSSPISALSLRIFRGRGSSTATLGTHDRFRVHRVRFQPRLCKKADIGVAKHDRSVRGSRSYADRFYQSADAQNAHYSFHVVGQDVQGHFGRARAFSSGSERLPSRTLSYRRDAPRSGGRSRNLSGFRSRRTCTASRMASCSQPEIRRSLPVVHWPFSAQLWQAPVH